MLTPYHLLWRGRTPRNTSSIEARFSATPTSGVYPLTVTFTPYASGAAVEQYAWDFTNDGVVDSTSAVTTYIYASAGVFSPKLTVYNTCIGLIDSTVATSLIEVSATPSAPQGVFVASPLSGTIPLTVTFTASASGPLSQIYWDPDNDGDYDSFGSATTFIFTSVGTYRPTMILIGTEGYDTRVSGVAIVATSAPITPSTSAVSWQPWRNRLV